MSRRKAVRSEIPSALKSVDVKAVLRKRGFYLKQRENKRLKAAALPLAEALVKSKKAKKKSKPKLKVASKAKTPESKKDIVQVPQPQKYTSFTDDAVQTHWEKTIHDVETIEKHFDAAIKRFLVNKVMTKALAKLQTIVDSNKTVKAQKKALAEYRKKDIFDNDEQGELINEATIDLEPILQNMGVIAGQDANKLIGITDPYIPSEAMSRRVHQNVEKFTKSMVDTDQEYLGNIITSGIENGDSVQQISKQIKDDFGSGGYSSMQATRVTRTEVLRSANQSSVDAFKQSGIVEGKQWVTAGADDECADYEGEVETLDGSFYDTSEFADGDPPLHPNCRCIVVPVLNDDSSS